MSVKIIILTLKIPIYGQILQKSVFYDKIKKTDFWDLTTPRPPLGNVANWKFLC